MSFLSRFFTRDSRSTTYSGGSLAEPTPWLLDWAMGSETASGIRVSPDAAAALPDVFACCQVLAQDIGRTPLKLQAVDPSTGNRQDAVNSVLWELLHDLPNPETTAYDFRYALMWDLLLTERAYAEIRRTPDGRVTSMWRLDPARVTVDRLPDGRKRWIYRQTVQDAPPVTGLLGLSASNGDLSWVFDPDKPPIFELCMRSPLRRVRETLGMLSAVERYGARFFANGVKLSGVFSLPPNVTDEAKNSFVEKLRAVFGGADNAHKSLVTKGDVKYTPFVATNNEAQFNETRKFLRGLIAGCFRMAPHKIGDLERATFSNIEHQAIEHVGDCLGPFYTTFEQSLRRDVLTTRQYPRFDVMFDRVVMIQTDLSALSDSLSKQVNAGIITINDARRRLGNNTVDPNLGDVLMVNANMVPLARQIAGPAPAIDATPTDPQSLTQAPQRVM